MIDIKGEPELRHLCAHLIYAVEALIEDCPLLAQYELDSIKEFVFWADDSNTAIEADLKRRGNREAQRQDGAQRQGEDGTQRQEEGLQGEAEEEEVDAART